MFYLYEYLIEKTEVKGRQICLCKNQRGMWGRNFII